jgi:sugar phosphate isomerase/epimerase
MRFAYVLPDPCSYPRWRDFENDLAAVKKAGYDAVELQITDPRDVDEPALRKALQTAGLPLCAVQTGGSYATRGNCLCSPDAAVRERTVALLRSFVEFASRHGVVLVFGSLQGRRSDEPDLVAGRARILAAMREVGRRATEAGVVLAYEPVNQLEVAYHNTIESVASVVKEISEPGIRMMIDAFHMNIEERDMLAPVQGIADILAHVHLSETNRDVLGTGHWPTRAFLRELKRVQYVGAVSIGVYNTTLPRPECIARCMAGIRQASS